MTYFKDFYLKAKARIWPGLSGVCHIRSTGDMQLLAYYAELLGGNRLIIGTESGTMAKVSFPLSAPNVAKTSTIWVHGNELVSKSPSPLSVEGSIRRDDRARVG